MLHRGEIVEKAVRNSGYALSKVSSLLGISRNTLYSRFRQKNMSYRFIKEIGNLIHYDFTLEFPELKTTTSTEDGCEVFDQNAMLNLEKQHAILVESHNRLLAIVSKIAHEQKLEAICQEISLLMDTDQEIN